VLWLLGALHRKLWQALLSSLSTFEGDFSTWAYRRLLAVTCSLLQIAAASWQQQFGSSSLAAAAAAADLHSAATGRHDSASVSYNKRCVKLAGPGPFCSHLSCNHSSSTAAKCSGWSDESAGDDCSGLSGAAAAAAAQAAKRLAAALCDVRI
jgi:hypothetical protein